MAQHPRLLNRPARHPRRLRPLRLAATLLALGCTLPASALDFVWLGGSGSWTDAAKWSLLGVPGAGDSATLSGASHAAQLSDTRGLGSLFLTNGTLGGIGTLNTGSASFGSAVLGWSTDAAEGTLNVAGAASFNGAAIQSLRYGQVVNLNGNSSWSVGNGRLEVGQAYAGNATTPAHRVSQLNIAAGTTFTDAGAAAAGGTKQIGYNGGEVNNHGTYVRNGLGTTAGNYGFNNLGTLQVNAGTFSLDGNNSLRSASSGQINVAAGATLNLGYADITAGAINNAGRVTMNGSGVATLAAGVVTSGVWELSHSSAQLQLSGNHSISSLALTSGYVGGVGTLNTGSASFGSAVLGWSTDAAEGTLNVAGAASFNGAAIQSLRYGQVVNLNGNSSWSAGNGRLEVGQAYAGNASTPAHRVSQLNIAAGTTFTDAGAAAAGGTKQIGYNGGEVNNHGTYVRNGLGTTAGNYGFNNLGTLQVNAGTFSLDGNNSLRSASSGQINVASGATLNLGYADITAGAINNAGRVTMNGSGVATLAAGVVTSGVWELSHSSAQLQLSGNHSISSLALSNGYVGGVGTLNTGSASFGSAVLGWSTEAAEGTLNVAGAASFNGAAIQSLRYGQVVNLNGNSSWSAGNGRLEVGQAYAGNASTPAHRVSQLNIAAGTTFTDAGAAAAGGTKQIGYNGGEVNNHGTYVRNGLGTTVGNYGFNNLGTLQVNAGTFSLDGGSVRSSSSGQINVAAGATLNLGNADITAGAINNAGRVTMNGSGVATLAAGAATGGVWELNHSSAQLQISGNQNMASLAVTSGYVGGSGVINTGSASFGSAVLGWSTDAAEGALNVAGAASFNGAAIQSLRYGQVVNLNGNSSWSAGNGRLEVGQAYAGNASTPAHRVSQLNIAAGTTFTDAGAAAAGGTKQIGYNGGEVNNHGTYVRNGLGTTVFTGAVTNTGTVTVNAGQLSVDDQFRNLGLVNVAGGAVLRGTDFTFTNHGTLQGTGTVQTRSSTVALSNLGHINPGTDGTGGALSVDGDLTLALTGTLNIDLVGLGLNDQLRVSDDLRAGGTLAVWAAGYSLNLGDSFVIATFNQLAGGTTFSSVTWNGLAANMFDVVYNSKDITLRVTAVPEPQSWLLLLGGLAGLYGWRRRRAG